MKNHSLIEYIRDKLDMKNVGPQILEKVNTLVDEAVWELKKSQVIPAKTIEFSSIDRKEEKRNKDNKVVYNYYFLPDDFHSLEEFFVDDGVTEPERRIPYQYIPYANYIDIARTNERRKFFTITDVTIDNELRKILIANPFPKDDLTVSIKYYEDGTESLVDRIGRRYWKIILKEIEGELNLIHPAELADQRSLEISRSKNQKGKNSPNGTMTKVKGRFFNGTTGRGSYFHKRKYR